MHETILANAIIQTVPQWYLSTAGKHVYEMAANNSKMEFSSHHPIQGNLRTVLDFARESLAYWSQQQPRIPTPSTIAKIKEDIALQWLNLHDSEVDWIKWIAYAEGLRQRTYENKNIRMNLIIAKGQGMVDITDVRLQKVFDPLASHGHVYMKVDKNLHFLDYDEIQWKDVKDSTEYKFSPEFLQPFLSVLQAGEFFVHVTGRGELIIADQMGMLASSRKGQWYIYDRDALRDCIVDIIGEPQVGRNLLEILFDLSYRRHGALLIFDPAGKVINQIVNAHSLIRDPDVDFSDLPRRLLASRIKGIRMGSGIYPERKKRLFLEIADIDGAVVFNNQEVQAFGAMIQPHPQVGNYFGARMMAAQSALLWGGHSFLISSDGEIIIFFSQKGDGTQAELRFM